jgi:hypothetical protein
VYEKMIKHEKCEGCDYLQSTYGARSAICTHENWKIKGCPINRWKLKSTKYKEVKAPKAMKKIIGNPRKVGEKRLKQIVGNPRDI